MKFNEGYWLRKESVQPSYATQGFTVEKIENGMRITAPEHPILKRADALDLTVLVVDFVSAGHNDIAVTATHYQAYDSHEPRFELTRHPDPVNIQVTPQEAVMTAGDITVRVDRVHWAYQFEAAGKVLTSSGFRNLGYMRVDKKPTSLSAGADYFQQDYTPYMVSELSLKPGECVYGLGERFTAFVRNGQVVDMWNEDGGTASGISYKNIPFYMTSEGYGVFVDHTDSVSFEVASEKVEYVAVSTQGEQLRYHLIYGRTPAEVLESYTALTGRPALPPAWTFGLWLTTSFKPSYDEKTVTGLIDGMLDRDIPLRVFHFDCYWMRALHWCDFEWDQDQFGDVKAMMQRYHDKGVKICAWINPYVAQNTDFFAEGAAGGYFLMRTDGHGIKQIDNWQPGMALVDFTNPAAVKWYTDKLKTILDVGVDCFKTDFGERIPIDVRYYDGSDPKCMHNYYTFLYNKAVFELLQKEKGQDEAVLFARSATAGSQQFPVHWGGDSSASYASMAETIRGGLSFAMSGFAFWSHDISGFESTATPDLYKRWVQFGLMSSHSRLHGSDTYRAPWLFGEEACDVLQYFTELKCSLMPYLYRMAVIAHEKGTPVMRPMPFAYPQDPGCRYLDMQYMLGDALLAAPVFNDRSEGQYYLPDGTWTNLLDGAVRAGSRWYTEVYDYFHMPLLVRENTILPIGSNKKVPDYDYAEGVTLHFYVPVKGSTAQCSIPDIHGKTVMTVTAHTSDDGTKVTWNITGGGKEVPFVLHMADQTEKKGVITDGNCEIML